MGITFRGVFATGIIFTALLCGCQFSSGPNVQDQTARRIFRDQCAACHSLEGQGSRSSVPMDHEGANRSQAWLEIQIRRPDKHNPGTGMPLFPPDRISDAELRDLAHYLASLK